MAAAGSAEEEPAWAELDVPANGAGAPPALFPPPCCPATDAAMAAAGSAEEESAWAELEVPASGAGAPPCCDDTEAAMAAAGSDELEDSPCPPGVVLIPAGIGAEEPWAPPCAEPEADDPNVLTSPVTAKPAP